MSGPKWNHWDGTSAGPKILRAAAEVAQKRSGAAAATTGLGLGSDIYSNYSSLQEKTDSLQINHYRSSKLQRQEAYF
jgi:hypothetical protein